MPHSCGKPNSTHLHRRQWVEERTPTVRRPTHEEIARLAYSYWEARGRKEGSPQEDWFRAERVLRGDLV
jgi:hypothetical protein